MYRSFSCDSIKDETGTGKMTNSPGRSGSRTSSLWRRDSREDNSFIGHLLTVSPAEELEFPIDDGCRETYDVISLKNTLPYSIAYKVKTTSPEKYRVRPSSGIVKPGSTTEVYVYLQQGYQNTLGKDKFLIMAMELTDETSSEKISELWKTVPRDNIMEHRLRCKQATRAANNSENWQDNATPSTIPERIAQVSNKVDKLAASNRKLQRMVLILLIMQFLMFVFVGSATTVYLVYSPPVQGQNDSAWSYCNSGGLF